MKNRNLKKIGAIAIAFALCIGLAAPSVAATQAFTDMPSNWSKDALQYAVDNGLLFGLDGKINPDDALTRAQMVAIVNRAFGSVAKADISKYTDVPSGTWYAEDIAKAVKMETLFGNGTKINPTDNVTREQAFAILARALKLTSTDYSVLNKFTDMAQIADFFKGELSALVSAGYVTGNNNILSPKQNITRAQFAQVMFNVIKAYVNKAGTYTTVAQGSVMVNAPGVTLKDVTISGDLIIGDGVGTGDVTLDNVKVTGRTLVRGGGNNSIHVINGSTLSGTVIIDNVNNEVRIVTDAGTIIQKIEAGSEIILEGKFGDVVVVGSETSVELKGEVKNLIVESPYAAINVTGKVDNIEVTKSATRTTITGTGIVKSVEVNANNVKIGTGNTQITVGNNVTGTKVGETKIEEGTTVVTNPGGNNVNPPPVGGGYIPPTDPTPAFAVNSITFTCTDSSKNITITSPFTLDLSSYTDSDANKRIVINGLTINATSSVESLEVLGYSDRTAYPSAGVFSLGTVTGLDMAFDGDVTVYTLKNLIEGSISKTLKLTSGTSNQTITLTIKDGSGGSLNVPDEFLSNYTVNLYANNSPTDKEIKATIKSGKGSTQVSSFADFFHDVLELTTVPSGYTYNGMMYSKDGGATYSGPYTTNYMVNLGNLLGRQDLLTIDLQDLADNNVSVKVTGSNGTDNYVAVVHFGPKS